MKTTIKTLCESTNIPSSLVRAVVRQFGGWEAFTQSAEDVSNHGIDGGFHGFIYHNDTESFAKRNLKAIAELAQEQASDFDQGVIEMIRSFNCFRGDELTDFEIGVALFSGRNMEGAPNILNALAWYAGEEVCRAYVNHLEQLAEA